MRNCSSAACLAAFTSRPAASASGPLAGGEARRTSRDVAHRGRAEGGKGSGSGASGCKTLAFKLKSKSKPTAFQCILERYRSRTPVQVRVYAA